MRSIRRTLGAALAVAVAVNSASAQGRAEQVVPMELVRTLVAGGSLDGGVTPRVLVGRIPEITTDVVPVPAAARIIGSIVYPLSTRSALAFAAPPDSVRRMMERELRAAGWEKFEPQQRSGFGSTSFDDALRFCMGDSATASLVVRPNDEGGTYLVVSHMRNRDYSMCRMQPPAYRERPESPIPTLLAPDGVRSRGGGTGGGTGSWHAHTQLETTTSIETLLAHYDAQLRAAGWHPGTSAVDGGLVLRTYRLTDAEGVHWNGLFTVSGEPGASHRFLSVLAIRAEDDRP